MSKTDLNERIKEFLNSALKKISAKDFDSAIDKLKEAESLDKDNPEILYNLGICYCKKELYDSAIPYFSRIQKLALTFVDILTVIKLLTYCAIMIKDFEQAKEHIENGLKILENDTTLLNMLGFILEKESKFEEALDIYKRIVDIDSNNPNAYNSIAYLTADMHGDLNEALSHARKALKHNPENPAYLDTMGYIQMKKGQMDVAKNYLKKALEKLPDSKEIKDHINQLLKITPVNE